MILQQSTDVELTLSFRNIGRYLCETRLFETSRSTCASNSYGGASILRIRESIDLRERRSRGKPTRGKSPSSMTSTQILMTSDTDKTDGYSARWRLFPRVYAHTCKRLSGQQKRRRKVKMDKHKIRILSGTGNIKQISSRLGNQHRAILFVPAVC